MRKIIKMIIYIFFYIKEIIINIWNSYFIYQDYIFDRFLNMKEEYYIYILIFLIIFFCYLYYLYLRNDIDTFTSLIFLYIYIMVIIIFVYFSYFFYLCFYNYTFIVPYYLYILVQETFIFDNYAHAQIFFQILCQDVHYLQIDNEFMLFDSENYKICMIKYSIFYYKIVFFFKKNNKYYIYFKVMYPLKDYIYPDFHKISLYILKFRYKKKYGDKYFYYYFKARARYMKKYEQYLENKNKKFYKIFFAKIDYILKNYILEIIDLYKEIFLFALETLKKIIIGEISIFAIIKMIFKAFIFCCKLFINIIQEIFIIIKEDIFKSIIRFIKYIIKIIKDNFK